MTEKKNAEEYPSQGVFIFQVIDTIQGTFILKTANADLSTEYPLNDTSKVEAKGIHAIAATQLPVTISGYSYPTGVTKAPMIFALVSDNVTLNGATEETIGKIGIVPVNVYSNYL